LHLREHVFGEIFHSLSGCSFNLPRSARPWQAPAASPAHDWGRTAARERLDTAIARPNETGEPTDEINPPSD
jgi:hypothetical protein